MKPRNTLSIIIISLAVTAFADPVVPFIGWTNLIESSPYIFIAKRTDPVQVFPVNRPSALSIIHNVGSCSIEIVSVLKGDAKIGPAQLALPYDLRVGLLPRRGDIFLIFASGGGSPGTNSSYIAIESYRTIVIAPEMYYQVWTNALAGKPLKEQIKKILAYRRAALNEEMEREQAEKKRVEDGLKELEK